MADCHLGGWTKPELNQLNLEYFKKAIDICISEKIDFLLIAGDLFDSAYPSIDILKETFNEFRKLKESKIEIYLIAGSHDYSVSGKTFLDVLEKAGFCKNVFRYEERNGKVVLLPTLHKNASIYGYPGKKSGLEVEEISKIILDDSPGFFKILMLHTTLKDAVPNLDIPAVDHNSLPNVDYIALGHLHIKYVRENRVYSGPTFPNNISELEELKGGSFYIFNNGKIERRDLNLNEVYVLSLEVKSTLGLTEKLISFLENESLKDKIVVIKLFGVIDQGKISDIDFSKIESIVKVAGAKAFLKSTNKLYLAEPEIKMNQINRENLEEDIIKKFQEKSKSKFNDLVPQILRSLQIEKHEDEKLSIFEERVLSDAKKVFGL